jgi:hypothetical protein
MRYLFKQELRLLCVVLLAGKSCLSLGLEVGERKLFQPARWEVASDAHLEQWRGGFDSGAGLKVSFGIERTLMVNGDIVRRSSFNLPDLTHITPEQARLANATLAEAVVVQNGSGNQVEPGVKTQLASGTILQNSLNDQQIQSLTVINTGVNSMGLLKSLNTQGILKDALLGSVGLR